MVGGGGGGGLVLAGRLLGILASPRVALINTARWGHHAACARVEESSFNAALLLSWAWRGHSMAAAAVAAFLASLVPAGWRVRQLLHNLAAALSAQPRYRCRRGEGIVAAAGSGGSPHPGQAVHGSAVRTGSGRLALLDECGALGAPAATAATGPAAVALSPAQ